MFFVWILLVSTSTLTTRALGRVEWVAKAITRHHEDKKSKATSSLFPIEMIAKLEWKQSNKQYNIEQFQNPTMGVTNQQQINNNRTTPLERTAAKASGMGLECRINCFS